MAPFNASARLVLLWLSGTALRITLLAIPPVLPLIHRDLQLDEKGVAAVSSLPVLVLGAAAVPGSMLIARVGARRALLVGLLLIGVGGLLRGVGPATPILLLMTLVMGAGIAVCQPSLPALVRQWYPDAVTRATGVWSNGLLVGELLGASFTIPFVLPLVGGSWEIALAVWSAPVLLTAALVAFGTPHRAQEAAYWRGAGIPDWSSGRMWQMGFLQSAAGLIYFGSNTFIPDYLHAQDQAGLVALALASLNIAQVPASFVIGLVPWRILARRETSVGVGVVALVALLALVSAQPVAVVVGAGVLGFAAAYILVLCFALPALVAAPTEVSRLSAGMFTISYVTSFVVTLLAGAAWDITHQPATAFLPVLLGSCIAIGLGPRLVAAEHARHVAAEASA